MMLKNLLGLLFFILVAGKSYSQDTLPKFSFVERGDRVVVSWTNPYGTLLVQLNVQRSFDSLRNYTTIFSATSPELPQNGYTEKRPAVARVYYRIFYVLQGGDYRFTKSVRAGLPPDTYTRGDDATARDIKAFIASDSSRSVTIKMRDSYRQIPAFAFRNFRDSILRLTRDTLIAINDTLVALNPYVGKENWRPSLFIYVNREGYINISLPLVHEKKYNVKFFEEDGTPLFEVNTVKDSPLILEKSSFIHSGWFQFELYEDNRLKEKNKLYLPKDF